MEKIFEIKQRLQAIKQFKENYSKISNLDDICQVIDELIERINENDCEFKERRIQELTLMKNDIIAEMINFEEENLELMEVWDGIEEW